MQSLLYMRVVIIYPCVYAPIYTLYFRYGGVSVFVWVISRVLAGKRPKTALFWFGCIISQKVA